MPWESSPKGWYAFTKGSYIHLRKGPKNWLADVSIYREDSLDKLHHGGKFKGRDLETVALKALSYLKARTGKTPVQIDLEHSQEYPVRVRTEEDEIKDIVDYIVPIIQEGPESGRLRYLLGPEITRRLEELE